MKLRIYTEGTTTGAYIDVEASDAKVSRELCGKDIITFSARTSTFQEFPIGSAVKHAGWMYMLNELPNYEKKGSNEHIYSFNFKSPIFDLEKILFVDVNLDTDFFFNGTASQMLDLLFFNITRSNVTIPNSFTKGTAPATGYKNIQFSNLNCLAALNIICDEFNLEYEHVQAYINLTAKVGNTLALSLEYGKGKGLYNIQRNSVNIDKLITRLYYRGSNRNLPSDYAYDCLHGSVEYIEKNLSTYGMREASITFDEIRPSRTGTISSFVIENTGTTSEKVKLVDSGMDFDLNDYIVSGTTPKISFLTGDMAGFTVDVAAYDHVKKEFLLTPYKDEAGTCFPSSAIYPAANDTYVLIDINMPSGYLAAAVSALDVKGQAYLDEYCTPRVSYTLKSDKKYFTENNVAINLGDTFTVVDTDLNISSTCRVISMEYQLFDSADMTLKLSDIRFAVNGRKKAIQEKQVTQAITVNKINTVEKTIRSLKTTNELKSKVFDYRDEHFIPENNRKESLDPFMIALDTGEMQFSLKDVLFTPNSGGDKTKVAISAGSIIHHSINGLTRAEIEKKLENSEAYIPYRSWTIEAATLTLSDDAKSYNLYAVIPTATGQTTATIVADEDHLWAKETADTIKYKLGFVSKVTDGKRTACTLWGGSAESLPIGENGDILIYNNGWVRLTKGTDGKVLTLASGLPSWAAAASGLPSGVQGDLLYHNGTGWVVVNKGAAGQVLSCNHTIPYWRSVSELTSGADGDTLYFNGGWNRLSHGTSGQFLQIFNNGGYWVTRWANAPASEWTEDSNGIEYTLGNVGVGAASNGAYKFYVSSSGNAIYGAAGGNYAGVYGTSDSGYGVYGVSSSGYGGSFGGLGVLIQAGGRLFMAGGNAVINSSGVADFISMKIGGTERISSTGVFTPSNGASGTFTTADGKTVTVTNGIITSIV